MLAHNCAHNVRGDRLHRPVSAGGTESRLFRCRTGPPSHPRARNSASLSLSLWHTCARTHTLHILCIHAWTELKRPRKTGVLQLALCSVVGFKFFITFAWISPHVACSFFAQSTRTPLRCTVRSEPFRSRRWALGKWGITRTVAPLAFIDPDKHPQPSVLEICAPETGAGVCVLRGRARVSWEGSEGWRRFLRR